MKLLILLNPHSGKGAALRLGERAAKHAKAHGSTSETIIEESVQKAHSAANAAMRSAQIAEPFTAVVIIGGDGTIHQFLPLAYSYKLPIAIIPAGTGNDLARTVGVLGKSPEAIIDAIHHSDPIFHDLGLVTHSAGSTLFIQVLSTGFDSVVNERANSYRKLRGKFKYVVATFREIFTFRAKEFRFTIDGVEHQSSAMLLAVANGPNYGGGMQVVPPADPRDGLLHLLLLEKIHTLEFLRVFPRVFSGRHLSHKAVRVLSGIKINISADVNAYADGERIGPLPISVTVLPSAIRLWNL